MEFFALRFVVPVLGDGLTELRATDTKCVIIRGWIEGALTQTASDASALRPQRHTEWTLGHIAITSRIANRDACIKHSHDSSVAAAALESSRATSRCRISVRIGCLELIKTRPAATSRQNTSRQTEDSEARQLEALC